MKRDQVEYDLAVHQRVVEEGIARAQTIDTWRDSRCSELECGDDIGAIVDAIPDGANVDFLINVLEAIFHPGPDWICKVGEIKQRLVTMTLACEEAQRRFDWDQPDDNYEAGRE